MLFHSPRSGNFNIFMIDLNAPGGVDALQGKLNAPVPFTTPSSPAPASSDSKPQDTTTLLAMVSLGVAGFAVLFGVLYLWQKRQK
jgi:hypothetical protein